MTLGGGFAPPVPGPIHAPGHQRDSGGVHDVDKAFEPEGELGAAATAKAGMESLQMLQHCPEELLRHHLRVALPVGVGEGVLARCGGTANGQQGIRVQAQRIAHVVESQRVGQLGVEQTGHMAPRAKRPGLGVHAGVPGQPRHAMIGNEIAELVQQRELAARWLVDGCFFVTRLVAGQPTASQLLLQPFTPNSLNLWDADANTIQQQAFMHETIELQSQSDYETCLSQNANQSALANRAVAHTQLYAFSICNTQ